MFVDEWRRCDEKHTQWYLVLHVACTIFIQSTCYSKRQYFEVAGVCAKSANLLLLQEVMSLRLFLIHFHCYFHLSFCLAKCLSHSVGTHAFTSLCATSLYFDVDSVIVQLKVTFCILQYLQRHILALQLELDVSLDASCNFHLQLTLKQLLQISMRSRKCCRI